MLQEVSILEALTFMEKRLISQQAIVFHMVIIKIFTVKKYKAINTCSMENGDH
jgi:hypothetical protein